MTNEEQLLAALEYQKAMRPAFGNPNLMRQGMRMNLPARQVPGLFSEFGTQAMSLNPQPDQGYGTMAAEMALGFVPGVGQAMAARDIERARRDNDPLGMALAGLSLLPLGKLIGSLRGGKQMGPVSELDVYHGSPHRFPPTANNPLGEFDPMKIGTGEGAQAYGAGAAYLAEVKGTATGYRDKLAAQQNPNVVDANLQKLYEKTGDWSKAVDEHMRRIYDTPKAKEKMRESLIKQGAPTNVEGGSLYKVDLPDEQIAKMLDWDKPLSQQSKIVQDALQPALQTMEQNQRQLLSAFPKDAVDKELAAWRQGLKGEDIINEMVRLHGGDIQASSALREAGIPGIRYLDQGSRVGGQGTSNFVVFDPKHMNIIERDGLTLEQALASRQDVMDIMKQTVPESSLMYRDPFGGIE